MKKLFSLCLALMIIFSLTTSALAAEIVDQPIQSTDVVQQEIDAILKELNEIAAEGKMASLLTKEDIELAKKIVTINAQNNLRKQNLESRLENLGVNTIDPQNPDDIALLQEIMLGNSAISAQTIPAPPDFQSLADCYTIHQYSSIETVGGTDYQYSYIFVTDNKGYERSPLTYSQTNNILIGKESTFLKDILDYQFSFAFSAYLGTIPFGWIADWTIGTVCAALESCDANSTISYSGNNNIYNMSMLSVTQMMYVYVYVPTGGWCLCGVRAPNISYTRAEYFIANVDGEAFSSSQAYPTVTSSTGSAAYTYVREYILKGVCNVDYIGSFTVDGYNGATVQFSPGFASIPIDLAYG